MIVERHVLDTFERHGNLSWVNFHKKAGTGNRARRTRALEVLCFGTEDDSLYVRPQLEMWCLTERQVSWTLGTSQKTGH